MIFMGADYVMDRSIFADKPVVLEIGVSGLWSPCSARMMGL
jgi:hypothetical protein